MLALRPMVLALSSLRGPGCRAAWIVSAAFALTLVSLMSLVGALVENGWVRLGVALVVAIGVPAFLVDRLLPDDDPARAHAARQAGGTAGGGGGGGVAA